MVAPSAWASHILVNSKSEAMQIKEKVSKLKDFQKDYEINFLGLIKVLKH